MGLMRFGFIGLVEFGVMCGSHVEAGRSYHGVEESPWREGSTHGASFESLRDPEVASVVAQDGAPLIMASRNLVVTGPAK